AAFFVITFMGGCTGSTAGGLKFYRLYVLLIATANHFRMLLHPHRIALLRYGDKRLDDEVVRSVTTFVLLYMASFVVIAGGLSVTGLDLVTSLSGSAQAIANVGPGLGDIIGPAGNFSTLSDSAKFILAAGMLLGRLEIVAVVMVFTPAFWRA
ncbi:MAG TPA: potassium transporter TrkG, partial [Kaistiaceae bacterium]|nr:potassium transporter TrkG [Kaistiaceae bacterium]